MIRHKPNRTSILENADFLAQSRRANHSRSLASLCPAPFAKIFLFFRNANQRYIVSCPVPPGGALRNVIDAGRDAVDADSAFDEGA
jgi:hypothetical protein